MSGRIRRGALLLGFLAAALLITPETRATASRRTTMELRGYASAYAPGRFEEVVRWRLDNDVWRSPPPVGWYTAAGYVATNDCSQVGQMATLIDPDGRPHTVLVADCGGADGGSRWMTENNIIAELDWRLWKRLTERHGRPLEIGLR